MLRHDTELEELRQRLVLLRHDEPPLGGEIEMLRDDLRALGRRPAQALAPAALRGLDEMCVAALAELQALRDPALASLINRLEIRRALVRTRLDAYGKTM